MRILHLETVDSTNTYALHHFADVADSVLVSAAEQTSGRGRLGRKWLAPPGRNITASFAMSRVQSGFHAGAIVGLASLDLVRETVPGTRPYFKWPNDIYIGDAKLAGILCEGLLDHGRLRGVVAGLGMNVNLSPGNIASIDRKAVSLKMLAKGQEFSLPRLIERLAFFLEEWYIKYDCSRDSVLAEWRRENRLLGMTIEVVDPAGNVIEGRFSAIDDDGSMILDTARGRELFRCGDVRIARGFDPDKNIRPDGTPTPGRGFATRGEEEGTGDE
jgi:BirA family biotin operon repressor/biotin-[acetyl-CoA-carboxylase] ligase